MKAKKKAKAVKSAETRYPLLVEAVVNHVIRRNITHEHVYEMERIMQENRERVSSRKLASWLHEHAMDNVPIEYSLLGKSDRAEVDKAIKLEAKNFVG